MTRLLMVVLMLGGIGCGVDSGSMTPAADPTDDPSAATRAASSSSADEANPSLVAQCNDGVCELITACRAAGGRLGAPCAPSATCCRLD
ncbi:MAG TPA: hypothetical protein VHW23_41915 [Kofleriaceae bacterium]|jgi:hypothetical protein|nr:hypothetical protein [Kofleriaceae bacterium]